VTLLGIRVYRKHKFTNVPLGQKEHAVKNLLILVGAVVEIHTECFKVITRKLANPSYITVAVALRDEFMEALVTSGVKARICELETAGKELKTASKAFTKALTKGLKSGSPTVSVTVVATEEEELYRPSR
jgi:hypothetical protein